MMALSCSLRCAHLPRGPRPFDLFALRCRFAARCVGRDIRPRAMRQQALFAPRVRNSSRQSVPPGVSDSFVCDFPPANSLGKQPTEQRAAVTVPPHPVVLFLSGE
jgi:hypothetical protein